MSRTLPRLVPYPGFRLSMLRSWIWWRAILQCFMFFSIIGHLMEIPYCLLLSQFDLYTPMAEAVWSDPWEPYSIYGIATVICIVVLDPFRFFLEEKLGGRKVLTFFLFFVLAVLFAMSLELGMGLLMNQPDPVTGAYPLWDNSKYVLNILNQAWLVNDLLLGGGATLFVYAIYPLYLRVASKVPENIRWAFFIFVCIVYGCCFTYAYFIEPTLTGVPS